MHKDGEKNSDIAEEVGLSIRQVIGVINAYKTNGRLLRKKGSGRPKALTKGLKRKVRNVIQITITTHQQA